ncbi:acyl-CoA thioesterase/BAAT N-terminal domain-containing protein [Brevibacillus invocatus]|nr:acyl-CoA thioesterase/BAAT N-terminal domain-containing protein [Brevibacillus invocatus]MCM3429454.1 acyl-CoA thioesterase/BAAT N-terminal domain-containing protein [Brevibacillus invocatus]
MLGGELEGNSYAIFVADRVGNVDLSTQAPIEGTYSDPDQMGLFWSMTVSKLRFHLSNRLEQLPCSPRSSVVTFTAEVAGEVVARAELTRLFLTSEVQTKDVLEYGFVGRFFYTRQSLSSDSPIIIALSGSEGGLHTPSQFAALFASHGYPTLALAYFNLEHLPPEIRNIPLEYCQKAIEWIKGQPFFRSRKIAVFGRSKGAELALVLGATFLDIGGVIASSPTSTVCIGSWSSEDAPDVYCPQSSWSYQGKPLPFIPLTEEQCLAFQKNLIEGKRVDSIHGACFSNQDMLEQATIPVEKIQGPLLLISSDDDHWWPSSLHCKRMVQRLTEHDFSHSYLHLDYQNVGHGIRFPYIPTTNLRLNGGTAKNNAFAAKDSWHHILAFLKQLSYGTV